MADRVADQRHAAQDEVIADQSARGGDQEPHKHNPKCRRQILRPRLDHDPLPLEGWNEIVHELLPYPLGPVAAGANGL